ncbi:MAG: 3-hydroxyacyl-CoA dehydrogenase NAD-binding domain-containing protein, partial [Bacteroidales bacterium]|nr:3-hydroxyacyl-CoA dehydrogenase NAD-binding domain-containing protein [Bacteroidales bacterium]
EYNIISMDIVDEFNAVLDKIEQNPEIKAAVLISDKKDFMAGADIREFLKMKGDDAKNTALTGHKLLLRIENSSKPFVAAIHGACMGGGTEISLACAGRVIAKDSKTMMALPEVKLGLLPGMGGTQRLPKLVGVQAALDMMLTGKNIYPSKAKKIGLVDITVEREKLLTAAKKHALNIAEGKFKRNDKRGLITQLMEKFPPTRNFILKKAAEIVQRQTYGNYPAPFKIIESVRYGITHKLEQGIENEVSLFQELLHTPQARQLINIFLGMTSLKKNPLQDKVKKVETIAVLGAGLMGEGIAEISLLKNWEIFLKDISEDMLQRARKNIRKILNKKVKQKSLQKTDVERLMNRLHTDISYKGFQKADLVIEAVFEDMQIKHKVIGELNEILRDDAIIASNTSALPIKEIAAVAKKPENVIGMHYFFPVPKMPLLEIIVHDKTADWVRATALDVGIKQGKTCIVVKDGPGFYTTRILAPYMNEALQLMKEGVNPLLIDKAMKQFGFPVGPVSLIDEVGIDVGAHVTSGKLGEFFAKRGAPADDTLKQMLDKGFKGRKNRKGFLLYDEKTGKKIRGKINPAIREFFPDKQNDLSIDEIIERMSVMMINEAVMCLEEGILENPLAGDIGAVFGLGFPPFRGGPFRYIDYEGAGKILSLIKSLHKKYGARFKPAGLLEEYAKENKLFYDDTRMEVEAP